MKKVFTLALAVAMVSLLAGCCCNPCGSCAPSCPEPVYQSPCCPAPSGDVTGPWGGGGGGSCGGGGGGGGGGSCGAACGGR
jgi:hypothetical protein